MRAPRMGGALTMAFVRKIIIVLAIQLILPWSAYAQEAGSVADAASSTVSPSANLDLSSTERSVSAASVMSNAGAATINLAGVSRTVSPTDMLTAAEMVAVRQVLNAGHQYLQLNELGVAVGGGLRLNYHVADGLSNLVIPAGVHASQNAALMQNLNLTGNFTNAGTFSVYSTNPAVNAASVNATNIYNNASGLISSTLANLNLNAINNIVNAGTISSSGNLNLTAGNSIVNASSAAMMAMMQANNISMVANNIVNSGTIAALTGNLNIASQMAQNLAVNNIGGMMQALNGNINFRDSSYSGSANISLLGGDYLSRQLNLYAGTGTATVSVGQIAGVVNTYAGAEHITADTTLLKLGNNISGDPTYYNTGGIEIVGTVSSDEDLAIVAGGDITADINGQIVTNGHNLLMIAGANITSTCAGCTQPGPGLVGPTSGGLTPTLGLAEGGVTVSLTGGSGGNIDLSGSLEQKVIDTSSKNSAGGNVKMVALADAFGSKGTVKLNTFCLLGNCIGEINTVGGGAGGGGSVTIYAGASSLSPVTSININQIATTSNGTLNSGSVILQTTQAVTSDLQPLVLDAHAVITSGNTIQPGATLAQAGISTGAINTDVAGGSQKGGDVTIKAYGDIDTSAGTIATINNGVGAAGEVIITSSNGSVSTGEIDSFVYSGWIAAANVTISAYGNITTNGHFIYAFQGGSGAGGTITLTSTTGSVSTGVLLTGVGDTVAAGNVVISAYGNITTDKIYAFNVGTGGGGTVNFKSSNGAISTGEIAVNTQLGLVPAGNVTLSAYGDITIGGKIDASNAGPSTGGSVTLLTLGSLTVGDIDTSTSGSLGGSITAAAGGDNGSHSIVMGNLKTSGSLAAGSVEIVSTDLLQKPNTIGTITAQASGQSGVGGAIGIATLGVLAVGAIDTTSTYTGTSSWAQSGSVFLSSGSTASNAITASSINAYNSTNGSATGKLILIASGGITAGTITIAAYSSSVNPNYTSPTTSISSSTTIDVSVYGITSFSNYNPQGYSSISGGASTKLTIDSAQKLSMLVPLLCLGDVSIGSAKSTNGAGVALVASGNITVSGAGGVNTVGTTGGGNVNLLSIAGQISVDNITTISNGGEAAGNVSVFASGSINIGGNISAFNSSLGAGGTVTLVSSTSSVSVHEIDTYVHGWTAAAGSVIISAYGDINTNSSAIKAYNSHAFTPDTGSGGTVYLVSSNGSVLTDEIDTYVVSSSAAAGNVFIAAYGEIDTNNKAIAAYNAGPGASGNVILISSNSTIATGAIDSHVTSGSAKAADVTFSSYGAINLNGVLNASNTGSGSGSTINLLSGNGSVTTGGINVNVSTASIVAGNVNIEATGAINTSAGTIQAKNGGTRPIDGGVTLLSHTSSVTTGGINISVDAGSAALAGDVSISAPQFITVGAKIDASNNGTGGGGAVTLTSSGNSVTVSDIDTHVQSSSALAGGVSILAYGLINGGGGTINTSNGGIGAGGAGSAGTVTLMSSTGSVSTGGISTNVSGGSAPAGDVTILANGNISASGAINTSNAGTGSGGEVALTSGNGSVSITGIQTNVGGGSAAAGNVIIAAPGAISATGSIATNNTGAGAGGSVALITQGTIGLSTIITSATTSGAPSGSVFLSSGHAGTGAIVTGAITLAGGALLATAATAGSIAVQSFANGNTLSVNAGQIFATGTYTSNINILPLAFTNSATVTITPAMIPGGGFTSFSNTGTVTLADDVGASGNVITFRDFLPVYVQGAVTSLGTINDSTGQANFFVMAPTVSVSSATTYTSASGSLNMLASQMSLAAINTNGANLNLTSLQGITTTTINTVNSGGTVAGSASLLSVIGSVTTDAVNTNVTSGSRGSGNVIISAYGTISTNNQSVNYQAINASNSGTGIGGTVNITISGNGSVETGQISTSINNTSSNAFAGNITILSASAIRTNGQVISASNSGTGGGGTLMLTSETFSIITNDIDTHVASGSAPAGNVFISALQLINTGNINASHAGSGTGGSVTLVRAAAMGTANIDTSSTGSAGGSIIAGAVGDNGVYTLVMGDLKTSGFTTAGSIMLVGDDFGAKPLLVGTITAQATGPNGVGGAVGISGLGTVAVGAIDTTNTAAVTSSGAQSGSVFLSSGSKNNNAIAADVINAYNSANGSATGQVILIASGTITTYGAITTSAGTISAQTFSSNVVSGSVASVNPNYTNNLLSITSSTTINVSVTGISGPSSNYNPSGYAALSGNDTVLTIDSGGNSSLLAPLVFTAFVPMTIKSINSKSHTAADGIALLVFGNLTLSDTVGINAAGSTSGGNVTMQSSAGQISITSIATNSSGSGAAGSINISAWAAIPVTGTINASNSGTGAGGTVFLASTDNSIATGGINTTVAGATAAAGSVTIATFGAMSINAINASNLGTGVGAGGTVLLTSSNSSITTGEIDTYVESAPGAGNVTISAYRSITAGGIKAYNTGQGSGTGGAVTVTSSTSSISISTGTIDTHVVGGAGNGGDVTISAYGAINISKAIDTSNGGTGTSGAVALTSSNGSVSTNGIIATAYGGLIATSNVTISAYGDINMNDQPIWTYNAGPGTGGTITLISSHGAVSAAWLFTGVGNTVEAGDVIISAAGDITTNLWPIQAFNQGTGSAGTVSLTSAGGSISTGGIDTHVGLGSVAAGDVDISAYGSISIAGLLLETKAIDASSKGTGSGGNVALLSRAGAVTLIGDVDTSSAGFVGGTIAVAAGGDNGLYSIAMENLNTSGSAAGGSVLVVSKNSMGTAIGTITTQASGQSGVGGSVGIATLGALEVGNIDTTNTAAIASSGAQSGSVFLSSGSTAIDAILAGDIKAYNLNGSASGQVILIASGGIIPGTITTSAGNSSVNPIHISFTTSISSSTTINVSVTGISGLFSNYNPQGYSSMSGGSTQLTINSGGNSSLLAPLLCLGDVSIASINSNSGTQADGVALVAFGDIALSGAVGVNTVGTTSGGNINLLAVAGQISLVGIETESSGAGAAGSVSMASNGAITVGGTINASNSGTGSGGTVTLISNSSSVTTGGFLSLVPTINTSVSGGSAAAGSVTISAFGAVNTSAGPIVASNSGTGLGGTVTLTSSNSSVITGEIDTNVQNASSLAAAGNVVITASGTIAVLGKINASNAGHGTGGIATLTSSNGSVITGEINTDFTSNLLTAGYVTISTYGSITTGDIKASNAGAGAGSMVTLLSGALITTGEIDANVSVGSTISGNVNLYAYGAVNAGKIEATNGGTVTLASSTGSVTTGEVNTHVSGGSTAVGAVSISAYGTIAAGGTINASNSGTGVGGTVTLTANTGSVTTHEIDTYVTSGSGAAGNVIISTNGAINTNNNAINAHNGGTGIGGTVFLISSNGSVATGGIDTYVSGGSAVSGTVTIQANGSITVGAAINSSNGGTGAGGAVTLTTINGSASIGGIDTSVSGGSAPAGNVIVLASGAITVTGAIATDNTGTGAGGSVALISGNTIGLGTIITSATTSGTLSGSVFLSSGNTGTGAIATGAINLGGGALLATAATSGIITVQSFTDGGTLSVDNGHIYATGTYTSAVNILPQSFTNSATATITPAMIPGGGFASFKNSGTVTLANDAGTSGNVIAFSDLVPVVVHGAVSSLGTINDSTGRANFFLITKTVSVNSATTYTSKTGSITMIANQVSLSDINTNGANLNVTSIQSIGTGTINTFNSNSTKAGNATLLSLTGSVTTGEIDTHVTRGLAAAGNVTISAYGAISTNQHMVNAYNGGIGAGGTVTLTSSGTGSIKTGGIRTDVGSANSFAAAGNVNILAASGISTNGQAINASNAGAGLGGSVTLTANAADITIGEIDTYATSGSAPAGNVAISAYKYIFTGKIKAYHHGAGSGGNVTLLRAVAMKTDDVDTSSAGFIGGNIVAASSFDNGHYSIEMGNLNTSGSTAGGSVLVVSDDFANALTSIGAITTTASGKSGVGGSVGIASLGTLVVGNINTTNTAAVASSGAQSGSVFLSSGKKTASSITAGSINAYNSSNGSATGQVILISPGTITTNGTITAQGSNIPQGTYSTNYVGLGNQASVNPNYTSGPMSISSSTTINVSVTGISGPTSNYNPKGYGSITGSDTVLTIDSGGNSSMIAPLFVTAFLPITIGAIKSSSGTNADGVALVTFASLTLTHTIGVDTHGSISGGNVNLVSEDGPISMQRVDTYSSGAGAAGNVSISFYGDITAGGTINASNSGTGSGGTVTLISTNGSVTTGGIDTSVAGGAAAAGNVTIAAYESLSTQTIDTSNTGTGAGGTVFLLSSNSSVTVGAIDTSANGGAAGNVFISAYGVITLGGNVKAYDAGLGGAVTLSAGGDIRATSSLVTLLSPSITLITTAGNIGSDPVSGGIALSIEASHLHFATNGNVYLLQQGDLILDSSVIGDSTQLNISVNGSGTLFLNGLVSNSSSTIGTPGQSINLSAQNIVNLPAHSGMSSLIASNIILSAPGGTIGASNSPIYLYTPSLSATNPNFIVNGPPPTPPAPSIPGVPAMTTNPFALVSFANSDLNVLNGQDSSAIQQVQNSNINFFQAGSQINQDVKWASRNSLNNIDIEDLTANSLNPQSTPPLDSEALGQSFAYCNASDFNSDVVNEMHSHGAILGSQSTANLCVLQKGNFFFQPQNDINVQVQEGEVQVPNGASVLVMETGHDVAVFDINDGPHARVRVKSGNKVITLSPGRQVVLTRQLDADFDRVNPSKLIGYKNARAHMVASDIRAYSADFSLPSVMMSVQPVKRMLSSDNPDDRRLVQRMIKQAVILTMLPSKSGPFKTSANN
ncbi:MAG: hypothetical protein K2Y22_02945 [Candidatus Obscuribacterales bacterium]|nr:hypothetical protein [Candidatus Obscuribacterales bacterium]